MTAGVVPILVVAARGAALIPVVPALTRAAPVTAVGVTPGEPGAMKFWNFAGYLEQVEILPAVSIFFSTLH